MTDRAFRAVSWRRPGPGQGSSGANTALPPREEGLARGRLPEAEWTGARLRSHRLCPPLLWPPCPARAWWVGGTETRDRTAYERGNRRRWGEKELTTLFLPKQIRTLTDETSSRLPGSPEKGAPSLSQATRMVVDAH